MARASARWLRYGSRVLTSENASLSEGFASLNLSPQSLKALEKAGYELPTPVQQKLIPHALTGKDAIACAATGTGKTAAFLLPIVERIHATDRTAALILAPTRELATQIAEHAQIFGAVHKLKCATVIGGVGMYAQTLHLKTANIVIATPGRLVDHLEQGNVRLSGVKILVLDEADRMLDMGFKPQLNRILSFLPRERQTLLLSATMAGEVAAFAKQHLRTPIRVDINPSGTTAARATQVVFEVQENEKIPLLASLLSEDEDSTLVFTRTKHRANKLTQALQRLGLTVERIHGNRSQGQRTEALGGFKKGKYRVLVATDIAARGIDVAEIGHVVNFDLPNVPADYVHRVGRTARAAASGRASAFASPEDMPLLVDIERLLRNRITRAEVPRTSAIFLAAVESERLRKAAPQPREPRDPRAVAQAQARRQGGGSSQSGGGHRGGRSSGGGGGGRSSGGGTGGGARTQGSERSGQGAATGEGNRPAKTVYSSRSRSGQR